MAGEPLDADAIAFGPLALLERQQFILLVFVILTRNQPGHIPLVFKIDFVANIDKITQGNVLDPINFFQAIGQVIINILGYSQGKVSGNTGSMGRIHADQQLIRHAKGDAHSKNAHGNA